MSWFVILFRTISSSILKLILKPFLTVMEFNKANITENKKSGFKSHFKWHDKPP